MGGILLEVSFGYSISFRLNRRKIIPTRRKDDVKAVATMNYDGVTSQFADLQMAGKFTTRADLL